MPFILEQQPVKSSKQFQDFKLPLFGNTSNDSLKEHHSNMDQSEDIGDIRDAKEFDQSSNGKIKKIQSLKQQRGISIVNPHLEKYSNVITNISLLIKFRI